MTDEQLAEIKARAEAATPGPWEMREPNGRPGVWAGKCKLATVEAPDSFPLSVNYGRRRNADFISHARSDIPLLLLEIERLRAEVERLTTPQPGPLPVMKHGFLAWAMQVEDALPPGMAMGVDVEELRRWHEAGMTARAAAESVRGEGP